MIIKFEHRESTHIGAKPKCWGGKGW